MIKEHARQTAFLRRGDGTLLAGDAKGDAWRSRDGGARFDPWPIGLHLRALGERAGRLYAATNNLVDPFAVGVSDDGDHFRGLFHYADTCGWLACPEVASACAPRWSVLVTTLGITGNPGCPRAPHSATDRDGGAAIPPSGGCGCRLDERGRPQGPPGNWLVALLLDLPLVGVTLRRRRSARRPR